MVPLFVGAWLYAKRPEIEWREWAGGAVLSFGMALLFQYMAVRGMTSDIETWSGYIERVVHYPEWTDEVTTSSTDSKGNTTYSTSHTTHPEHWAAETSVDDEHEINEQFYWQLATKFGRQVDTHWVYKADFDTGDHNIYIVENRTAFLFPITGLKHFENRVKAAPTLFSYSKVPPGSGVFTYPKNSNWMASDRLQGWAKQDVSLWEFDCMNARLGASKKVNVIMCGFGDSTRDVAELQEAAWVGGKKNDLVLCYGANTGKVTWARVFGWSNSELVKRNIETIMLEGVSTAQLPRIEAEIRQNYTKKNWHEFDYITLTPPTWAYVVYVLVQLVGQGCFWVWALGNQFSKGGSGWSSSYGRNITFEHRRRVLGSDTKLARYLERQKLRGL